MAYTDDADGRIASVRDEPRDGEYDLLVQSGRAYCEHTSNVQYGRRMTRSIVLSDLASFQHYGTSRRGTPISRHRGRDGCSPGADYLDEARNASTRTTSLILHGGLKRMSRCI